MPSGKSRANVRFLFAGQMDVFSTENDVYARNHALTTAQTDEGAVEEEVIDGVPVDAPDDRPPSARPEPSPAG